MKADLMYMMQKYYFICINNTSQNVCKQELIV